MSQATPPFVPQVSPLQSARREAAKTSVIASGNAQAVLRRLDEVEEEREANLNRWAWELLQNARDAAGIDTSVNVTVRFDGTKLQFEHDGPPFQDEEIAHLIYHGSTKRSGIGRFGTGFISTHLLSRVVRIRGPLDEGTLFEFDLDRRGSNPDELKVSMDRSWESMNGSVRQVSESPDDRKTVFSYPISEDTSVVVERGLDELLRVTPFVLAFNPQFLSLSIARGDSRATYRVIERPPSDDGRSVVLIGESNDLITSRVLLSEKGDVQVAIAIDAVDTSPGILPKPGMSRMYVAFPLSSTANYPFNAATNSEKFHPLTERDGIYLASDGSPKSAENRERFLSACDAFGRLVEFAIAKHSVDVGQILILTFPAGLESVSLDWLRETVHKRVIEDVVQRSIVATRDGTFRSLHDALIPFAEPDQRSALWKLFSLLKDFGQIIPVEADIDAWNDIVTSWSQFSGEAPDASDDVWSVEDLVRNVAKSGTITSLAERVEGDVWSWLSSLLDYLDADGSRAFCDKYDVLPNQKGMLTTGKSLFRDEAIPAEVKAIAEALELPGRGVLLADELSGTAIGKSLKPRIADDLLRDIVDKLDDVLPKNRNAVMQLFQFVVKSRLRDWLDQVPIITSSVVLYTTGIALGTPPHRRLLAPRQRWEGATGKFADLFPSDFVLHGDYANLLDETDWAWLVDQGAILTSTLVTESVHVEDFIDVVTKEGKRGSMRSKDKVTRSHIAHLSGDDCVLERVRGSRRLGILLIKFLFEAIIPKDDNAFIERELVCDDEEWRRCYTAAWIGHLLSWSWVRHERKSYSVTAESLALLLGDESATIAKLLDASGAPFLKSIGVSPADLALRTVGKSDEDRMSLIRSLGVIVGAVGNDPTNVARLAATIQRDSAVLDYIQQREAYVARMERNQSFGFAVETAFRTIFTPELGIAITRTGHGHDFSLTSIIDGEDDGGTVELTVGDRKVFVELKATRGPRPVHMSVRQVQSATSTTEGYWLCVVELPDGDVTPDAIREHAFFICDIGTHLTDAWLQYGDLQDATPVSMSVDETGLEVTEQAVRFRVGHTLWSNGISFEDTISLLRSRFATP